MESLNLCADFPLPRRFSFRKLRAVWPAPKRPLIDLKVCGADDDRDKRKDRPGCRIWARWHVEAGEFLTLPRRDELLGLPVGSAIRNLKGRHCLLAKFAHHVRAGQAHSEP